MSDNPIRSERDPIYSRAEQGLVGATFAPIGSFSGPLTSGDSIQQVPESAAEAHLRNLVDRAEHGGAAAQKALFDVVMKISEGDDVGKTIARVAASKADCRFNYVKGELRSIDFPPIDKAASGVHIDLKNREINDRTRAELDEAMVQEYGADLMHNIERIIKVGDDEMINRDHVIKIAKIGKSIARGDLNDLAQSLKQLPPEDSVRLPLIKAFNQANQEAAIQIHEISVDGEKQTSVSDREYSLVFRGGDLSSPRVAKNDSKGLPFLSSEPSESLPGPQELIFMFRQNQMRSIEAMDAKGPKTSRAEDDEKPDDEPVRRN